MRFIGINIVTVTKQSLVVCCGVGSLLPPLHEFWVKLKSVVKEKENKSYNAVVPGFLLETKDLTEAVQGRSVLLAVSRGGKMAAGAPVQDGRSVGPLARLSGSASRELGPKWSQAVTWGLSSQLPDSSSQTLFPKGPEMSPDSTPPGNKVFRHASLWDTSHPNQCLCVACEHICMPVFL